MAQPAADTDAPDAAYLALAFAEAGVEPPDDPAELDAMLAELAAADDTGGDTEDLIDLDAEDQP